MPPPDQYEWTDFDKLLSAIETFCALDGYDYQSCEHPGWQASGAFRFCRRVRRALIGAMPGYAGAEWHWSAEVVLARADRGHGARR